MAANTTNDKPATNQAFAAFQARYNLLITKNDFLAWVKMLIDQFGDGWEAKTSDIDGFILAVSLYELELEEVGRPAHMKSYPRWYQSKSTTRKREAEPTKYMPSAPLILTPQRLIEIHNENRAAFFILGAERQALATRHQTIEAAKAEDKARRAARGGG